MEQVTHSAKYALSGLGLAKIERKRVRRSRRRRLKGPPVVGTIVPLPQGFSKPRPARATGSAGSGISTSGAREQEWVQSHWREYAGRWVALDGNRLVGEATVAREALEKARALGVFSPFLVHVTEPSELPFGGW